LAPGDYEIVIDGPSLVASIDKLAPPAPEKKREGSSFSLGIGGMFGGGGHSGSGHPGAGPVGGGGHGGSSGGGIYFPRTIGADVTIPVGGADNSGSGDEMSLGTTIILGIGGHGDMVAGGSQFSSETPYCRDAASHGIRIKFTIPPGPAASDYTGWYLGFGIGYG